MVVVKNMMYFQPSLQKLSVCNEYGEVHSVSVPGALLHKGDKTEQ